MSLFWKITPAIGLLAVFPAYAAEEVPAHTMDAQLQQMQSDHSTPPVAALSPTSANPPEMIAKEPIEPDGSLGPNGTVVYQSMIESKGSGAIEASPLDIQTKGDISYVNGGISDEELDMIKALPDDYNVRILIRNSIGKYAVATKFHILDQSGLEVINIEDAGPYVYAKLTPGMYTIEASQEDEIQAAKVKAPKTGYKRATLTFKPQKD